MPVYEEPPAMPAGYFFCEKGGPRLRGDDMVGENSLLHVADDVAEAGSFLEVEARGSFLHLAFEVGKLCR